MMHLDWDEARAELAAGKAVVLWKAGCGFCDMLMEDLAGDDRVVWVDVHADESANAKVRALNDGNELTPTVLVGERVLINPTGEEVQAALA